MCCAGPYSGKMLFIKNNLTEYQRRSILIISVTEKRFVMIHCLLRYFGRSTVDKEKARRTHGEQVHSPGNVQKEGVCYDNVDQVK